MHGLEQEVVHPAGVAEAHLRLGRMHVDVHRRRVEAQREHVGRVSRVVQDVAVGAADRVGDQSIPDHPAVDEEQLLVGRGAGVLGTGHQPLQGEPRGGRIDLARLVEKAAAEHRGDALLDRIELDGRQIEHHPVVVAQAKRHLGVGERELAQQLVDVAELGTLGTQKLAARGHVEEEIAHVDQRAGFRRRGAGLVEHAGGQLPAVLLIGGARNQPQAGDGLDAGQRLATKAEAGDRLEIIEIADLAGRVGRDRQGKLLGRHAVAVVAHGQLLDPAGDDLHLDPVGTGIEGVFHQFLDHAGRPLDHLAGGDLVDQGLWQLTDLGHGAPGKAAIVAPCLGSRQGEHRLGLRASRSGYLAGRVPCSSCSRP